MLQNKVKFKRAYLKVHKNENFFWLRFWILSYLNVSYAYNKILVKFFFYWTIMRGATIIPRSLKTTRNEKNVQDRPKF